MIDRSIPSYSVRFTPNAVDPRTPDFTADEETMADPMWHVHYRLPTVGERLAHDEAMSVRARRIARFTSAKLADTDAADDAPF